MLEQENRRYADGKVHEPGVCVHVLHVSVWAGPHLVPAVFMSSAGSQQHTRTKTSCPAPPPVQLQIPTMHWDRITLNKIGGWLLTNLPQCRTLEKKIKKIMPFCFTQPKICYWFEVSHINTFGFLHKATTQNVPAVTFDNTMGYVRHSLGYSN